MGLDAVVFSKDSGSPVLEMRLGNVAEIAHVREALLKAGANPNGVLLFCVWSGSHSGDEVNLDKVADLRAEIDSIAVQDNEVKGFLNRLGELAEAAQSNSSSICFV